ncbi:hypothetical protein LXL04_025508 [Taraxacum kok-saghyz]
MDILETSRKRKASDRDEKSPVVLSESPLVFSESLAEFFAENKNNAGFENPGKALYTTVRELAENGLDSAESIGEFPVIQVTIEEISRSCYRVTCKDNGRGISHDAIPDIFGQVLVIYNNIQKVVVMLLFLTYKNHTVSIGKKYGMKQTRGKSRFGGAKMVSVWSKMSTGVPIEIYTGMKNQKYHTQGRGKGGFNIFWFANRVTLLFEQDADVVTTTAMERIKWKHYKINMDHDKVGVFVNIVSTKKIPFKGTVDDTSQIADAVKTCLEHCCKRLKQDIHKAKIKSNFEFILNQASSDLAFLAAPDNPSAREEVRITARKTILAGLIKDGLFD